MLPDFLVIGAAKCGTTSLCKWLAEHPEVGFSRDKEPFFFSNDERFLRGLSWYEELFEHHAATRVRALGEGSTHYSQSPHFGKAPDRIAHTLPNAKLIYIVRHPLEQIASYYLWNTVFFKKAAEFGIPVPDTFEQAVRSGGYLTDVADYAKQWQMYADRYPAEQLKLFFFEDLKADPRGVFREACEFIGVDPAFLPDEIGAKKNATEDLHAYKGWAKGIAYVSQNKTLRSLMPGGALSLARDLFKTAPPPKPRFTPELLDITRDRLGASTAGFLQAHGKPADYWRFDPEADPEANAEADAEAKVS